MLRRLGRPFIFFIVHVSHAVTSRCHIAPRRVLDTYVFEYTSIATFHWLLTLLIMLYFI